MKLVNKNKNLKKLQQKELEILKYFDIFCKENDLTYYLSCGTLLGAVRHKGFIPWDDDIDVFMKGEDFLKLQEIFNQKADKKYFFQSITTEKNYYLLWNKIRLNNTIFVEEGWENNEINNGIFIDVFPLIEYPSSKKEEKKVSSKLKFMHLLIETNIQNNQRYDKYGRKGKMLFTILKLLPQWLRNTIVIKNIRKLCLYKSDSEYYYSLYGDLSRKFSKEPFKDITYLNFEDTKLPSPIDYDKNLKEVYGDYMTLPEPKDRVGHGKVYLSFGDEK